jgi:hypothetical protein
MGTWGYAAFDNDSALDWFGLAVQHSSDTFAIESAIEAVLSAGEDDYIDAEEACAAVAAAELVAALRGHPSEQLNPLIAAWVSAHPMIIEPSLGKRAALAVTRIEGSSELKDVWGETSPSQPWRSANADLVCRLVK